MTVTVTTTRNVDGAVMIEEFPDRESAAIGVVLIIAGARTSGAEVVEMDVSDERRMFVQLTLGTIEAIDSDYYMPLSDDVH